MQRLLMKPKSLQKFNSHPLKSSEGPSSICKILLNTFYLIPNPFRLKILRHITSCHITSCHITSCHITSCPSLCFPQDSILSHRTKFHSAISNQSDITTNTSRQSHSTSEAVLDTRFHRL